MFTENIKFRYPWRSYQQRVLDEIEKHLDDNKLHVIAPPGSGKTVLGLETVRLLNKKTLILSPSITIRDQWIDRFVELFSNNTFSDYSLSLKKPAFLTSSTYQSLHAASSHLENGDEESFSADFNLISTLSEVKVLVLDEAHHLKSEWWKSIMTVLKTLDDITLISLTGTPPYDSTAKEWERYLTLCGPVDAEISVPELVKEKNLCPHQDLICFSEPSEEETEMMELYYRQIDELLNSITGREDLKQLLREHPVMAAPENHTDLIYSNVEYYAGLVIFLHYKECPEHRKLQRILGLENRKIPVLNGQWLETILTGALFTDPHTRGTDVVKEIKKQLKALSAVENKKVVFTARQQFNKMLSSSQSKFRSIREITDHEHTVLGNNLRMVILSDYVRKEALGSKSSLDKFGVVPIYKYLVKTCAAGSFDYRSKTAVLSGSLCIVPPVCLPEIFEMACDFGLNKDEIKSRPLGETWPCSELILPSARKNLSVPIVTRLLERGHINIIVGTKSLLGEGWDCPAINSLILATFTGSYMLSNQMRGRAIRTHRQNPHKTSNIWHLMCVDTVNRYNNYDYELLLARFKCFTGLDSETGAITNGLDRLHLKNFVYNRLSVNELNDQMRNLSRSRPLLYEKWFRAIGDSREGSVVKELKAPRKTGSRRYILVKSVRHLIIQGISGSFLFVIGLFKSLMGTALRQADFSLTDASSITLLLLIVFILASLPVTISSVQLLFRHGPVAGSFRQIAGSVLETMKKLDLIENSNKISLRTGSDSTGFLSCSLSGCSAYEQSVFLNAVREITDPVENPRYLITREGRFFKRTSDYHSVPAEFGKTKERAEVFHALWKKHMGPSQMYYTRNSRGRAVLVKARTEALSAGLVKKSELTDSWRV